MFAIIIALILALLVGLCGGPLLPFWMFINSLQLVIHTVFVRSDMPSLATKFLQDYFVILGYKSESFNEMVLGDHQI